MLCQKLLTLGFKRLLQLANGRKVDRTSNLYKTSWMETVAFPDAQMWIFSSVVILNAWVLKKKIVTSLQLQWVSNLALSAFVEPSIVALCIAANT